LFPCSGRRHAAGTAKTSPGGTCLATAALSRCRAPATAAARARKPTPSVCYFCHTARAPGSHVTVWPGRLFPGRRRGPEATGSPPVLSLFQSALLLRRLLQAVQHGFRFNPERLELLDVMARQAFLPVVPLHGPVEAVPGPGRRA